MPSTKEVVKLLKNNNCSNIKCKFITWDPSTSKFLKIDWSFHKGQISGKWLQTKKRTTETFREKLLTSSEAVVYSCSTDYLFLQFQKIIPLKDVSTPETCGIIKYRPHQAVSLWIFLKNSKKLLLKAMKKTWWRWKLWKKTYHVINNSHYQIWK